MRRGFLVLLLAVAGAATAQRAKPAYDPETKDGLLIEHIMQERDPAERLRYLEQFSAQYPSHAAIAWVYDQLQPAYFEVKEYEQAMRIGALRLAIEPENMEAAELALRSADARKDPDEIVKWAGRLWRISAAIAAHGDTKQAAEARQNQNYAESIMFTAASQSTDAKTRLELLQSLEQCNPSTKYVPSFAAEYFNVYRAMGNQEKAVETAEKGLKTDPGNVDMLIALTEFHFHKETARDRQLVIGYASRAAEALEKKDRPAGMSAEEWASKKAQTLGVVYYMGGMASSQNNSFRQADQMLRAALPYVKDEAQEAALLYYLGMANYRLAESGGDRSRPVDALKFMRRCAAVKSPYQEQAARNVAGIKSEYNLP